jgi:hypothetical protein
MLRAEHNRIEEEVTIVTAITVKKHIWIPTT